VANATPHQQQFINLPSEHRRQIQMRDPNPNQTEQSQTTPTCASVPNGKSVLRNAIVESVATFGEIGQDTSLIVQDSPKIAP
jgi:hypothetical protein